MVSGAALTLALTGNIRSATGIVVLIVGAVLLPVAVFIVRRRIWAPLTQIERAIQAVSEGDLSTQVPVMRDDELGTVATHFNHMTRALRDRAEEQGRFAAAGELLGGVAHEVSNPLMAIAVHAENRLADPTISQGHRGEMTQIPRQTRRATRAPPGPPRCGRAPRTPGVPPEIAAQLFRPFATTKGRRGTGLGLYISRQIAREGGGDLILVPVPGEGGGARFVLSLPAAVAPVDRPEATVAPPGRVSLDG